MVIWRIGINAFMRLTKSSFCWTRQSAKGWHFLFPVWSCLSQHLIRIKKWLNLKANRCKFSKDQNCTALLIYVSLTTSAELIIFTIQCKATSVSVIQVCIPRNESCQFLLLPSKSFTNSLCISRKLYKTKNSTFTRTQCTIAGCMASSRSTFFLASYNPKFEFFFV